ncbi:N/A [soil metagenome]
MALNRAMLRRLYPRELIVQIPSRIVREALTLIVDIVNAWRRHRVSMLARQAAYSLLYAVPSIFLILASLANLIDSRTGSHVYDRLSTFIYERAPLEIQDALSTVLDNILKETPTNTATAAAAFSILIAIWGGASGTGALIFSVNYVYDVGDKRSFISRKLLTLGMTVFEGLFIIATLVLFTLGSRIGNWLAEETGRSNRYIEILNSGRLTSAVLLFVSLAILYVVAPDVEQTYRWRLPGVIVATVGIVGLYQLVGTLLQIVDPTSAYGATGSILILLWFLYITSLVIITGAVVNSVVGERFDKRLIAYLAEHPERRIRETKGDDPLPPQQEALAQ